MSIVIVYAPQGAGKTTHAEALRKHYGCVRVVDDWKVGDLTCEGDLMLTNDESVLTAAVRRRVDLVTLDDALADMEGESHG
tara:strand:- start:1102 stop:1344 length:243 start_codon:yes stop_codon:yes gene_type:complete